MCEPVPPSGHRVPFGTNGLQTSRKAELASMLPGFRFLFAAIVLSMSVLVFGLGAAALLRTAHEEFASLPSRRAPPETVFAKQNETSVPTLALLRFDPPVAEKVPDDAPVAAVIEAVAPPEQTTMPEQTTLPEQTTDAAPGEPEKLAALKPEDPLPADPVTPTTPADRAGDGGVRNSSLYSGRHRNPRHRNGVRRARGTRSR